MLTQVMECARKMAMPAQVADGLKKAGKFHLIAEKEEELAAKIMHPLLSKLHCSNARRLRFHRPNLKAIKAKALKKANAIKAKALKKANAKIAEAKKMANDKLAKKV